MNTKNLIRMMLVIVAVLSFSSCKYDDSALWDKINDHENRIAQLEELCNKMNTNISSLQTIISALQDNDYVTSITPVTYGDEVIGYTINFSKSGPVTIYHGENGRDGIDGEDGHTPILGVKKDSDGNYYWTIDGSWLLDDEGNKIRTNGHDGTDGVDGSNGADGQNGKDGITPQVKIENGYWYVSYDNGESWQQLGEATGGSTPQLGVRQDSDGNYYWTVDGEWLLDDAGNKVRANGTDGLDGSDGENGDDGQAGYDGHDGITPQLKIEDEYWYVSYDNGLTWTRLWKATGDDGKDGVDGKDGDSMFSMVTYDDDFVYLVLADGTTTLMIPRKSDEFSITFVNGNDLVCSSGETIVVPYTLTYGDESTEVAVIPHGGWDAAVEKTSNTSGNIFVTAPSPMKDGEIIVLASDGHEKTVMRKLIFVQGVMSVVSKTYLADSNASTIDIELSTNLNYTVSIPEEAKSWIRVFDIKTKATMRNDVVTLAIDANINNATRTANVSFVNSANEVLNTVTISQTGSEIADNEIWYISLDGSLVEPDTYNLSGTIVSNTYGTGKGVIVFDTPLTEIWDSAFYGCKNAAEIILPGGVTNIGEFAFGSCSATKIYLPKSLTNIENGAFSGGNLEEIAIPDGVTNIASSAFSSCRSLRSVQLPKNITSIESWVFIDCISLQEIQLPEKLKTISNFAFDGCKNLSKIQISGELEKIGLCAIRDCASLSEVYLPESLTEIGRRSFDGCYKLEAVFCAAPVPPALAYDGSSDSIGFSKQTLIYVPSTSVEQYKMAEGWSEYASQISGYYFNGQ